MPLSVVDKERSDVSLRTVEVRTIRLEVSKDALGDSGKSETCLRHEVVCGLRPRRGTVWRRPYNLFPSLFFISICFFQIWPRRSQMLGAPGLIDDGIRFVYVEAIEVVGDNADGCVRSIG